MTSSVYLGIRLQPNQYQKIKLDNINLDNTVNVFKDEVAEKLDTSKQKFELLYAGVKLNDESSLDACGIKNGVTIHVLQKRVRPTTPTPKIVSEDEIIKLVTSFRTFSLTPGYRAALHRLSRSDVLEKIIAATPGLAEDPAAIAYIREPELIVQMSNIETVRRLAKLHPCLIDAAYFIATEVHEGTTGTSHNDPTTSSGFSYSLDALSEDDDMDSSNDAEGEGIPVSRNSSFNTITAAQLAAAIANASSSLNSSVPSNPPASNSASSNIITSEMFTNAMQQAFSTVQQSLNPSNNASSERTVEDSFESMRTRFQSQLQQMQEIGLINEAINLRALQATTGDVQAAIELVLSGAFE